MSTIYDYEFNKRLYRQRLADTTTGAKTTTTGGAVYNQISDVLNPSQFSSGAFMGSNYIRTTATKNRMIWSDGTDDRVEIGNITID